MKSTSLTAAALGLSALLSHAQTVPGLINYQGRVTDSTGNGIGTGTPVNRKMIFRLYGTATGGNPIWSEQQTVTLANGEFSVLLGSGIDASYGDAARPSLLTAFGTSDRYLELVVDNGDNTLNASDTPIAPRQRLTSAAYALKAASADTASRIAGGTDLSLLDAFNGLGVYAAGRQFNGVDIGGPVLYGYGGGALGSNFNGTPNTALRWDQNGNVGIGKTNPSEKLDVTGNAKISGNLTAGSMTSTGDITAAGVLLAGGIKLPGSAGPDGNFVGTAGNFISFATGGVSEDFLGYKNNVFYFRDSPGGGDTVQPSVDVGGNIAAGGSISAALSLTAGSITTSGAISAGSLNTGTGLVTTGGINSNGNIALPYTKDLTLLDANHGLGYYGAYGTGKLWSGVDVNGPVLYGFSGGALGTTSGGQRIALQWDSGKNVAVTGNLTAGGKTVAVGEESLRIVRGIVVGSGAGTQSTLYGSPNTTSGQPQLKGAGYKFRRDGSQNYTIQFAVPFGDVPSFTFTPSIGSGGGRVFSKVTSATASEVQIQVNNDDDAGANPVDFHFIAVGPR